MIIVVDQGVGDMFLSSDRHARPRQRAAKFSGRIKAPKMSGKFDQIGAMPDMTVAYLRFVVWIREPLVPGPRRWAVMRFVQHGETSRFGHCTWLQMRVAKTRYCLGVHDEARRDGAGLDSLQHQPWALTGSPRRRERANGNPTAATP